MKKNLASLSVAFIFATLAITGLLLYFKQKAHAIEISHTIFGLLMVILAGFHIFNNWKSLSSYAREKSSGKWSKPFVYIFLAAGLVLALGLTEVLEPVAEFGKIFAPPRKPNNNISFTAKSTREDINGAAVTLLLQKEEKMPRIQMTVEVADTTGKVLETIWAQEGKTEEEKEAPTPNLLLNSRIQTRPPFVIQVVAAAQDKKEVIKTRVDHLVSGEVISIPAAGSSIKRALLEVN